MDMQTPFSPEAITQRAEPLFTVGNLIEGGEFSLFQDKENYILKHEQSQSNDTNITTLSTTTYSLKGNVAASIGSNEHVFSVFIKKITNKDNTPSIDEKLLFEQLTNNGIQATKSTHAVVADISTADGKTKKEQQVKFERVYNNEHQVTRQHELDKDGKIIATTLLPYDKNGPSQAIRSEKRGNISTIALPTEPTQDSPNQVGTLEVNGKKIAIHEGDYTAIVPSEPKTNTAQADLREQENAHLTAKVGRHLDSDGRIEISPEQLSNATGLPEPHPANPSFELHINDKTSTRPLELKITPHDRTKTKTVRLKNTTHRSFKPIAVTNEDFEKGITAAKDAAANSPDGLAPTLHISSATNNGTVGHAPSTHQDR
jgi:hypothetical protein